MALIKCPQCGNQVSDKAITCPHCGVEVQKVFAEIRKQKKKRKRRFLWSLLSVFLVVVFAGLAYLYYIDGLNTIPAEYRKKTEDYLKNCEYDISTNNFDHGNDNYNIIKRRTLTRRQANRSKRIAQELVELGLSDIETTFAAIRNNPDTVIDLQLMQNIEKQMDKLKAYQLDTIQLERLKSAKKDFVEVQLAEIEKLNVLYEKDNQNEYSFDQINRFVQNLKVQELSTTQKARLDEAVGMAEKTKTQKENKQHQQLIKTIKEDYIGLLSDILVDNPSDGSSYFDGYFVYDIDKNGVPEIWIKTGTCEADCTILAYTYDKGTRLIYADSAGHSTFYKGDGYIIKVQGHMGHAVWYKLTFNGTGISTSNIYEEYLDEMEDYKEPRESPITFYSLSNHKPVINAFNTKKH